MMSAGRFALATIALLLMPNCKLSSQTFFQGRELVLSASYGVGKFQFYFDHTPTYVGFADQEAVEYSPSWGFEVDKHFWMNKRWDFKIGISHLTVTEKSERTATPGWIDVSAGNNSQSFIHLTPAVIGKLAEGKYLIHVGLRLGTASFFSSSDARSGSNALGNADIDLDIGARFLLMKNLYVSCAWIHGMTKYVLSNSRPIDSYFKYHSFQAGLKYAIQKREK